jgi:hypothetical protein
MAEAAILATVKVIGDVQATELVKLVVEETSNISCTFTNLKASMNSIRRKLRVMKGYLDEKKIDDDERESHAAWINVANLIEDIIAEVAYLVGNKKFDGISFYMKTMVKKPKVFIALKRITYELLEEEKSLKHIAELKERWVTKKNTRIHKNKD